MEWQYGAVGMTALARALQRLPGGDAVAAQLSPETAHALRRPALTPWHDGAHVVEMTLAVFRCLGPEAVETLYREHVRCSIGPLLEPFFKVVLATRGRTPAPIFETLNDSLCRVIRGVRMSWATTGCSTGLVTIEYPEAVPAETTPLAWCGALQYAFELCGTSGVIRPAAPSVDGRRWQLAVSWR